MERRLTPVERKERAREEILEAAARAIATHGFHGMSMRQLARATERSLANFYNHFDSKEAVLKALQVRAFETLISNAQELVGRHTDPAGKLYLLIANHVAYFNQHPSVMRVLVHEASALESAHRAEVRDLKERYFRVVRDAVEEVGRAGGAASGDEASLAAEIERRAYCVFGMMNWVFGWYEPPRHGTVEDIARTIHDIAMSGVVSNGAKRSFVDELAGEFAALHRPSLIRLVSEDCGAETDKGNEEGESA